MCIEVYVLPCSQIQGSFIFLLKSEITSKGVGIYITKGKLLNKVPIVPM